MGRSGSILSEPLAGGGGSAKPRVSLLRPPMTFPDSTTCNGTLLVRSSLLDTPDGACFSLAGYGRSS